MREKRFKKFIASILIVLMIYLNPALSNAAYYSSPDGIKNDGQQAVGRTVHIESSYEPDVYCETQGVSAFSGDHTISNYQKIEGIQEGQENDAWWAYIYGGGSYSHIRYNNTTHASARQLVVWYKLPGSTVTLENLKNGMYENAEEALRLMAEADDYAYGETSKKVASIKSTYGDSILTTNTTPIIL